MASAQVGKTLILKAAIGYYIDQDPSPILIVQPTLEIGEAFSKDRLAPMVRDTQRLRGKIADPRSRNSGNTILHKALAIDTPLPTPDGWKNIGDISVGDFVFDESGAPTKVTYVTPIVEGRPCFTVKFSDGCEIVADDEHPWLVEFWRVKKTNGVAKQVLSGKIATTADIRDSIESGRRPYAVKLASPLQLPDKDLPVHPYILGAWLGDGYSHRAMICAACEDVEIADHLNEAGATIKLKVRRVEKKGVLEICLDPDRDEGVDSAGRFKKRNAGTIRAGLDRLGIITSKGGNGTLKAIPPEYLRASFDQRLALLQGLMDTDGSARGKGDLCVFSSSIGVLANGFAELLSGLGVKFSRVLVKTKRKPSHRFEFSAPTTMPVFKLARKLARQMDRKPLTTKATYRRIVSVVETASVPVRCISVESESHLYLAGAGMIPTHNTFPGGHLTIAGANSPASLASRPIRVAMFDEVDRYPASAGAEGDPVGLGKARTKTFWNRKLFLCSTPTDESTSRINRAWLQSDMRRFWVPCAHCGEAQHLRWAQVQWVDDDPDTARYACEHCGALWTEGERALSLADGGWKAQHPERKIAGFHLSELYSPWRRLSEIVTAFLAAKGHRDLLKVWTNTSLGEVWADNEGEGIECADLPERREPYDCESVPAGALVVVAAIDVQDDRLEIEFKGFGIGEESWGLDYVVIAGDPGREDVWTRCAGQLQRTFVRDDGVVLGVYAAGLDTGGHHTRAAYEFARKHRGLVFALKGIGGAGKPLVKPGAKIKSSGVRLWIVGTDTAKELILLSRLRIAEHGPGFMHWPISTQFGIGYFEQLTAERAVTRYSHGQPHKVWTLPSGRRNEALDLNVYALATLAIKRPNLKALAAKPLAVRRTIEHADDAPPVPVAKPKPKRPASGGWMSRYR